jgi:MFS family permease
MTDVRPGQRPLGAKPWIMLVLGVLAQAGTAMLTATPAFLIPELHNVRGVPLATAGLLASTTTIGMVVALVAWGALADRIGERWVLSGGLGLAAVAAAGAALCSTNFGALAAFLVLAGIAGASSSPASGRLIVGWFPKNRRGLAMGIRQMSQPLGVAIAALVVPPLAEGSGIAAALLVSVIFCGVIGIACAVGLRDPARAPLSKFEAKPANPYRGDRTLVRIHLVSILLVIPQFTISTFGLIWLISDEKLPTAIAGLVVGLAQLIGALGRVAVGVWSDRLGSRMRPLRWVALASRTDRHTHRCFRPDCCSDHQRRGQRSRVRCRSRDCRSVLVRPRPGCSKHRTVDRRITGRSTRRPADRRCRLPAHLCRIRALRPHRCTAHPEFR